MFAIGGKKCSADDNATLHQNDDATLTCEKFDISMNCWVEIADLPYPAFSMNMLHLNKRFIYVFGG